MCVCVCERVFEYVCVFVCVCMCVWVCVYMCVGGYVCVAVGGEGVWLCVCAYWGG